jgi:hypothetical protein
MLEAIDWVATGSMLAGIGTLFGGGAVIYAAHKGTDTFRQWRRQKSEERRIILAEQILTLAYRVRRAIDAIRSPVLWGAEKAEVIAALVRDGVIKDDYDKDRREWMAIAGAAFTRANAYKALWDGLLDIVPTAKAIFGDEVEVHLESLWNERNKVLAAAQRHSEIYRKQAPRNEAEAERIIAREEELESLVWAGGNRDGIDAIANAVDARIAGLETILLPIIRADADVGSGR